MDGHHGGSGVAPTVGSCAVLGGPHPPPPQPLGCLEPATVEVGERGCHHRQNFPMASPTWALDTWVPGQSGALDALVLAPDAWAPALGLGHLGSNFQDRDAGHLGSSSRRLGSSPRSEVLDTRVPAPDAWGPSLGLGTGHLGSNSQLQGTSCLGSMPSSEAPNTQLLAPSYGMPDAWVPPATLPRFPLSLGLCRLSMTRSLA